MKNKTDIETVLSLVRENDIILVRTRLGIGVQRLILAPLIRLFTKSKYNHAALISDAFAGDWVVVEADQMGFRPSIYLKDWLAKQTDFVILRRKLNGEDYGQDPEEYRKKCFENMLDILFKPYDFASTLFYQVIHLLSKKKHWVGKSNSNRVNCSEAVAYIHGELDYYKFLPVDFLKSKYYSVILTAEKGILKDI